MRSPQDILVRSDMELPRSPQQFLDWIDAKAEEFSRTREGKVYARSGRRLPKKLWEELRPLALFALKRFGDEGVRCIPNLSNENFDGKIEFLDSREPIHVEITYAKDGYDERLRLEVLNEKGSVSAVGKITANGTKASGREIHVASEAVERSKTCETALELVKKRIADKGDKQYGNDCVLVVVIDDYLVFRFDEDKAILESNVSGYVPDVSLDVGAVYLLGSSGAYCKRIAGNL